jgi:hypothetical protein
MQLPRRLDLITQQLWLGELSCELTCRMTFRSSHHWIAKTGKCKSLHLVLTPCQIPPNGQVLVGDLGTKRGLELAFPEALRGSSSRPGQGSFTSPILSLRSTNPVSYTFDNRQVDDPYKPVYQDRACVLALFAVRGNPEVSAGN